MTGSRAWRGRARRALPSLLLICAVLVAYTTCYLHDSALPSAARPGSGWWSWWDQGEYLRAARAWADGDLNPDLHWYFPGYPILGALFCRLMPAHPFFLPDALLLVLALYLFVEICGALDVDRIKAAIIFIATVLVPPAIVAQFVVPWTTTPAMVLILAVLLAALRYGEAPAPRWSLAAGACGAGLLLFRPTDLIVLLPVVAFGARAAARDGSLRHVLRDGAAFCAGFAVPAAIALAIHLAIYGPHESGYMQQAAGIGFNFAQLPAKWVTIFLDPHPLFAGGEGILHAYPWVGVGIIGAVQFSLCRRSARHAVVTAAMLAYAALYLSYVDLLPSNIWAFQIIHYFKWLFPFFGLFAFLALRTLSDRKNWPSFAAAVALSAVPLCLHVKLVPVASSLAPSEGPRRFVLDVAGPVDVIDLPLSKANELTMYPAYLPSHREKRGGRWVMRPIIDIPPHELQVDGKALAAVSEFQIFASPSGARIVLLRHPAQRVIAARLAEGNTPARPFEIETYSTSLGMGWPAWLRLGEASP
ncbi:MAG TPA: hypothetical protein VN681_05590 [Stellaceae bacterium]|nr:hypothetical protein [Stellaceae bacterium]